MGIKSSKKWLLRNEKSAPYLLSPQHVKDAEFLKVSILRKDGSKSDGEVNISCGGEERPFPSNWKRFYL